MDQFCYKPSTDYDWEDNSYIKVEYCNKTLVKIISNKEGLLSLSKHFYILANSLDTEVCYEPWPGDLEEGSVLMEVIKTDTDGRKNI